MIDKWEHWAVQQPARRGRMTFVLHQDCIILCVRGCPRHRDRERESNLDDFCTALPRCTLRTTRTSEAERTAVGILVDEIIMPAPLLPPLLLLWRGLQGVHGSLGLDTCVIVPPLDFSLTHLLDVALVAKHI